MREFEGNPGKRPIPKEPAFARAPRGWAPPDHLHGQARKAWELIVAELQPIGVLATVDRFLLASFCTSWGRHLKAELMLRREGDVRATGALNTWMRIYWREQQQLISLSARFGLTPADRARIAALLAGQDLPPATPPAEDDPDLPDQPQGSEFGGLIGKVN